MPRFSFPVPGRRQKHESAAVLSPPLSKAQKILGTSQINVDSSVSLSAADLSQHWETASNSCISISISETLSYEGSHDGGLSSLTEGTVVNGQTSRHAGFDEESGVLPRVFVEGYGGTDIYGHDGRSITDASSLRRKQSSSTIMSYYDKSKVPLVISQQTSSSAMAKGLPAKASSLLDIDGSIAQSSGGRKKKPAKLDLSRMFANRKSSSTTTLSAERGSLMGPDIVARSPSFISVSPLGYLARPLSSHRRDKKARPSTRGSSRDNLSGSVSPRQKVPDQRYGAAQESTGLKNLYDHYEQMTYRDVFDEEEISPEATTLDGENEMASPLAVEDATEDATDDFQEEFEDDLADSYAQHGIRDVPSYKDIQSYLGGYSNADTVLQIGTTAPPKLPSPAEDCSDSISSRHTRTSRASKRTEQSLLEIDLQQTSVLSLSSDSEDDFVETRPKTATFVLPSPRSENEAALGQDGHLPRTSFSGKTKKGRTGSRSDQTVHFLPVPTKADQPGPAPPPPANPRSSAASVSTNSTTKPSVSSPQFMSRDSRASVVSNKTVNSIAPSNYTVHEARAITLIPAQGASYNSAMKHNHTSSSDQLTPPLSPSSVDFMMRSNHTSVCDTVQGPVRSGGSFSAADSSRSPPARSPTARSPTFGQGRFIAVTRQEELLLAALRQKRLRMRESIIAEFEEEQEKDKALELENGQHQQPKPTHELRRTSIDAVLELHAPQPRSVSQNSVSFKDFPMHFEENIFPMPPSACIRRSIRSSSASSIPLSPRSKPPTMRLPSPPIGKVAANADLDRVLTYLDNSTSRKGSSSGSASGRGTGASSDPASDRSDDLFGGEASPHLSDCLDFDDGRSGSIGSYDSFNFQTPADQSPIDAEPPTRRQSCYEQPAVAGGRLGAPGKRLPTVHDVDDDFSVHNVDEPMELPLDDFGVDTAADDGEHGIPRPDSPLESPLPFPRKREVRISAVGGGGRVGMEVGWWGDDG